MLIQVAAAQRQTNFQTNCRQPNLIEANHRTTQQHLRPLASEVLHLAWLEDYPLQ
jgi:hypothetical protein